MEQVHFHFEDELNPVCKNTVMQKYTIQMNKEKFLKVHGNTKKNKMI